MRIYIYLLLLSFTPLAFAKKPEDKAQAFAALAEKDTWTDEEIVQLYQLLPKETADSSPLLKRAVADLKFPEEGRPKAFFDAIASYLDSNRGGALSKLKLNRAIEATSEQYIALLKDSESGKGPQQQLATDMRIKSWKLLQKFQLFKAEMKKQKLVSWKYERFPLPPYLDEWEKAHTINSAQEFKKRVCEASQEKPVLVKFGSTQCADCMLMEYTQGMQTFAELNKEKLEVYKIWWGPNLGKEMDELRKREGVKSSPSFFVYRKGVRYRCDYQFPNQLAGGMDKCMAISEPGDGSCGG